MALKAKCVLKGGDATRRGGKTKRARNRRSLSKLAKQTQE